MEKILITGDDLSIEQVVKIALGEKGKFAQVELGNLDKVQKSVDYIQKKVENKEVIYGVTTGFGPNAEKIIPLERAKHLQVNLLRSHSCGVGKMFPTFIVRAIMLIRLNTLLKGFSGVHKTTVQQLQNFLNHEIHPLIPEQGSVGASGDLCPLSHMALALIGEGYVEFQGTEYKTAEFFELPEIKEKGLKPIELSYKEGIALNNGTTVMAALGVFAVYEFERLLKLATLTSSLMFEAYCARKTAFDEKIHAVRNHAEQSQVANWIRQFTENSTYVGIQPEALYGKFDALAKLKIKPQDAYSFRCVPQVFGASLRALNHAKEIFAGEINAVVDNPIIFVDEDEIISGGNFHGQPLALALDYLKLAIAEIGNIVERQINKLVDKATNDLLEPFLVYDDEHINSGLMIPQYVAASLVSENKVLVHPASADSIPTSANTEDHVSMGTIAGRQALEILGNVKKIVTIAILTAHHAAEIRQNQFMKYGVEATFAKATGELYDEVKFAIPAFNYGNFLYEDRFIFDDIQDLADNYDNFVSIAESNLKD
ncbi:MAG TPA: aromatic amino acid ammonia-lyase [Pyrinomonadaceae bacterium]|nr:aromatic amino acid ammonia-lyase [Pyrinomonadaceae bacterium]